MNPIPTPPPPTSVPMHHMQNHQAAPTIPHIHPQAKPVHHHNNGWHFFSFLDNFHPIQDLENTISNLHLNPFEGMKFVNPFTEIRKYYSWGEITFIDAEGAALETHVGTLGYTNSEETNWFFKFYEEKTAKYIAYEANARKFLLDEDLESRGKCPIMSLLTSESQIQEKMMEKPDSSDPFYVEPPVDASKIPTAMFHGFGDFCDQPGDIQFNHMLH